MRSMLVIGMGRFGRHLAVKLTELGDEVMVVDIDEEIIEKVAPYVTHAQIGDCMDIDNLNSLGVSNFDSCFVCISDNFQSSLEITSLLKELGAKRVVAKADRDIHAKFLLKIGADEVVYPERDMAQRAAVRYSVRNALDFVDLAPDYALFEMKALTSWEGKSLRKLGLRAKYNLNILGIKEEERVHPINDPDYVFRGTERLLVAGDKKRLMQLLK